MPDIVLSGMYVLREDDVLLLHKIKDDHWEKPGGKLELRDVADWNNPTIEELMVRAMVELQEEIENIEVANIAYLGAIPEFKIRDGRTAVAHAFVADYIAGEPTPRERHAFDRAEFISLGKTSQYRMSPDFEKFFPKLNEYAKKKLAKHR
jgi:hypothetical protein